MPVIHIDGLQVSYSDLGTGLPIVFVPGVAGSKDWFHFQTSGLSDRYRIISYDLRSARGRSEYSLQTLVNDLDKFLTALKLPGALVIGHSLGGLIALEFALRYPNRCLGLVLSSVTPAFPELSDTEMIAALLPGEIKVESFFKRLWKRLFGAKQGTADDYSSLSFLSRKIENLDPATLEARLNLLRKTNLTAALGRIEVPTLIVAGSEEKPYILAGAQLMEQSIDGCIMEIIENADHYFFYTRHDLYNSIIADFAAHKVVRV